jgi:hypothetical protein
VVNKFRSKTTWLVLILVLACLILAPVQPVEAQTYRFTLPQYEVEAYIEADGSVTLYYYMVFENDRSASPLDFVDLGLPKGQYKFGNIEATIDGKSITGIGASEYVSGAELPLRKDAIQPGATGTVIVYARAITHLLYSYDQDDHEGYANFQFMPNYFGSEYDRSRNTKYRVTIILPPDVGVNDGVYYEPAKWPGSATPEASTTQDGRVYYSWYTENADVHTGYVFGAAFPASAVPAEAVGSASNNNVKGSNTSGSSSNFMNLLTGLACCLGSVLTIVGMIVLIKRNADKAAARKMQYLPPKISIAGQGIKRGLTAVEAGILMELPLDRILTMILFGLLKKEAVAVLKRDPLELEIPPTLPADLHGYELGFLMAFRQENQSKKRLQLKSMMIDLVKDVSKKMKGFSKAETVAYYKDIVNRAWLAVETAKTPEIKSAEFDKGLEWTMLDGDFNQRTERTFTGGPVILPRWWGRYDPVYRTGTGSGTLAQPAPSTAGGPSGKSAPSLNLPRIPGSDFAASVINGGSAMAASAIGNVTDFTRSVTNSTNPIPVSHSSSGSGGFRGGGGGGSSCACACACAGCACACAGGGR